jgi:hypothetical protein
LVSSLYHLTHRCCWGEGFLEAGESANPGRRVLERSSGGGWDHLAEAWRKGSLGRLSEESMLVSCDVCNKLAQMQWLKTTKVYSFTVLEAIAQNHLLRAEIKVIVGVRLLLKVLEVNTSLPLPTCAGI